MNKTALRRFEDQGCKAVVESWTRGIGYHQYRCLPRPNERLVTEGEFTTMCIELEAEMQLKLNCKQVIDWQSRQLN